MTQKSSLFVYILNFMKWDAGLVTNVWKQTKKYIFKGSDLIISIYFYNVRQVNLGYTEIDILDKAILKFQQIL